MNYASRLSSWSLILMTLTLASCASHPVVNPKFDPAVLPGKSIALYSDGFYYYCAAGANYYDADETIKINEKLLKDSSDYLQTKGYQISSKESAFVLAGVASNKKVRISLNGNAPQETTPPLVISDVLKSDPEYAAAINKVFEAIYSADGKGDPRPDVLFVTFARFPSLPEALSKIREKAKTDYAIFVQSRERRDTVGRAVAVAVLSLGLLQANCRSSSRLAFMVDLSRGELLWKASAGGSASAEKLFGNLPPVPQ
jgi:hypothetical protein